VTVQQINYDAWWIWYVTWLAAVVFSARTKVQNGRDAFSPGRLLFGMGFFLILVPGSLWLRMTRSGPAAALAKPLWTAPDPLNWILFALVLAGFAFCWWARLHLGKLWSGLTTLKDGHYIVDTGPYGIVRHPIYSGILFSALMSAGLNANLLAALGFVSATLGLAIIARIEEGFLRDQLGAGAYAAYAARVPMLIPTWMGGEIGASKGTGPRT
jgi:protein-S-isoprenylcysteine O-methyltransferase Ste14